MNTSEYWKQWFDDRAKNVSSDYVLNRGTTLRLTEVETKAERQFLEAVAPDEDDVVLDAGCGSGRNISLLSPRVKAIVGLDFSAEMLARAEARVAEEQLPNVRLVTGSVTELPFPDATFDKIVCTSVLQYLDAADCRRAFAELFRVARHGATIVVHIKNGTSLYGLSKVFANATLRVLGRPVYPEYYRSRSWHEARIREFGGTIAGMDSMGVGTFVRMPRFLLNYVARHEARLQDGSWLKRYGVNYKITIRVAKPKDR